MEEYLDYYRVRLEYIQEKLNITPDSIEKILLEKLLKGYKYTYQYMLNKIQM